MKNPPTVTALGAAAPAAREGDVLSVMSRGVLAVLECPDIHTAAAHVLTSCRSLIGAGRGRFALLDADRSGRWVARIGPSGPAFPAREGGGPVAGLAELADRVGGGLVTGGRTPRPPGLRLPRACAGWKGLLAVPLGIGGRTEGLLLLGDKPGGFTPRDLTVAASFAALAAAAHQRCIATEELGRQVRGARAELSRANRVLRREVRAKEKVRASLEREHAFRVAVEDSLLTGILVTDPAGRVLHVNAAFCRIVGWPARLLVGASPPHPFWPPEAHTEYLEKFRRLAGRRVVPEGYRARFRRSSGEAFEARVMVAPLRGEGGKPTGWVASVADITGELRTQAELRQSAEQLRVVSARLIAAEERERKRIARELHDSLGQTLTALRLRLEGALSECRLPGCGHEARRGLRHALRILGGAAAEVRNVVADLRPAILDDLGLAAAISWFCREFNRVHPGVRCSATLRLGGDRVPEHLATTVFRLVQEGLTNVLKHSHARHARVRLGARRGRLELSIEDDGRGFRPDRSPGGSGLVGMRERTELAGGAFSLTSTPGAGTMVRASWPLAGGES